MTSSSLDVSVIVIVISDVISVNGFIVTPLLLLLLLVVLVITIIFLCIYANRHVGDIV